MSIWCSIDHGEELVPVDRDNYSGEPETGGGTYFVDVATSHLYHDCTRFIVRRCVTDDDGRQQFTGGVEMLLTPAEVRALIHRLSTAYAEVLP